MDFHGLRVVDFDSYHNHKKTDVNVKIRKPEKSNNYICVRHDNDMEAGHQDTYENKNEDKTVASNKSKRNPQHRSKSEIFEDKTSDLKSPFTCINSSIEDLRKKFNSRSLKSKFVINSSHCETKRNLRKTTINKESSKKEPSIHILYPRETSSLEKAKRLRKEKEKLHHPDSPCSECRVLANKKRQQIKPRPKSNQKSDFYSKEHHESYNNINRNNVINVFTSSAKSHKHNEILIHPNKNTMQKSNALIQSKSKKASDNSFDRHESKAQTSPVTKAVCWEANAGSNMTRIPELNSRAAEMHLQIPQSSQNSNVKPQLTEIPVSGERKVVIKISKEALSIRPHNFDRRRLERKEHFIKIKRDRQRFSIRKMFKSISSFYAKSHIQVLHSGVFGKRCLKYVFFGLLVVIWAPGLLAVIFAWILFSPFTFALRLAKRYLSKHNESGLHKKDKDYSNQLNLMKQLNKCYSCATTSIGNYGSTILSKVTKGTTRSVTWLHPLSASIATTHTLNPRKRYTLCYCQQKGWIAKPMRGQLRTMPFASNRVSRQRDHITLENHGTSKDRETKTYQRRRRQKRNLTLHRLMSPRSQTIRWLLFRKPHHRTIQRDETLRKKHYKSQKPLQEESKGPPVQNEIHRVSERGDY